MIVLTVYEIVRRIKAWQSAGFLHPLTCGKDSNHKPLVPHAEGNEVVLKCPDCDYIQEWIPEVVLEKSPEEIKRVKEDMKKKGFKFK